MAILKPSDINADNVREVALPLLQAQALHCASILTGEVTRWTDQFVSDDGTDDVTNSMDAVASLTHIVYEGTAEELRYFLFSSPQAEPVGSVSMPASALSCAVCPELEEYVEWCFEQEQEEQDREDERVQQPDEYGVRVVKRGEAFLDLELPVFGEVRFYADPGKQVVGTRVALWSADPQVEEQQSTMDVYALAATGGGQPGSRIVINVLREYMQDGELLQRWERLFQKGINADPVEVRFFLDPVLERVTKLADLCAEADSQMGDPYP